MPPPKLLLELLQLELPLLQLLLELVLSCELVEEVLVIRGITTTSSRSCRHNAHSKWWLASESISDAVILFFATHAPVMQQTRRELMRVVIADRTEHDQCDNQRSPHHREAPKHNVSATLGVRPRDGHACRLFWQDCQYSSFGYAQDGSGTRRGRTPCGYLARRYGSGMTKHSVPFWFAAHLTVGLHAGCSAPITTIGADDAVRQVVYVSTNTGPIHVYALDMASGRLSETGQHDGGVNPTFMAFSPNRRFAFVVNEADPPDSKVKSFAIDAPDGELRPIDGVDTGAAGSAHVAVHPSGRWLALPHYGRESDSWTGGQTMIVPIERDGSLGEVGMAQRGPESRLCVNAHQAVFASFGRYILVPCLGSNYVLQYRFERGQLQVNDPPFAEVPPASDPRHIALSIDQRHAYLLTERTSTIVWFHYDAATGLLSEAGTVQATLSPIPEGKTGWSGHIAVHPSGRFLYVSNRRGLQDNGEEHGSENSIGVFKILEDGEPEPILEHFITDLIDTPRNFTIDPTGQYLISINQQGEQNVLVFRIEPNTGALTRTDVLATGDRPAFVHALGALRTNL